MIFAKRLSSDGHIREFVVTHASELGWEVREAEDDRILRRSWLHDWHRVETTVMRFSMATTELERAGWTELQAPTSSVV